MTGDRGSGHIGALVGMAVILCLLSVASQTLVWLHHASTVQAVAYDAARRVATSPDPAAAAAAQSSWARGVLGRRGADADIGWAVGAGVVQVAVTVDAPRLLWPGLADRLGVERIRRSARVRIEASPVALPTAAPVRVVTAAGRRP